MLTKRMQIQTITNLLTGQISDVPTSNFEPTYRAVYQTLLLTPPDQRHTVLDALVDINPGLEVLVGQIVNETPDQITLDFSAEEIDTLCLNDPPLEYLWQDWIPRREMSMVLADPGVGKTLFVLDLCRRMLNGQDMPDGKQPHRAQHNILFIDAEDYRAGIYTRVRNWRQAEPSLWSARHSGLYIMPYPEQDVLDFAKPQHQDALLERIISLEPDWVIVDSISSALVNYTFDQDVIPAITYFKRLIRDHNLALTFIHHWNKKLRNSNIPDINSIAGAGLFARRSRVVIGLGYLDTKSDEKERGPRLVKPIKVNERRPNNLAFDLKKLHPQGIFLDYFDPKDWWNRQLDDNYENILNAVQELGDEATIKNLADHLELSRGYLSTILSKLTKAKKLKKLGGRGKPYVLVDNK